MDYFSPIYVTFLFIAMLLCLEAGRRRGLKKPDAAATTPDGRKIVEAAFFGLLSLLVAFCFSGAVSRFDHRRALIVEEANDIQTAYLRIVLLPAAEQPQMRERFRAYLDSRLETYRRFPDVDAVKAELARSNVMQEEIFNAAAAASRGADAHPDAGKLLLPALNAMINITTTRTWAAFTHPPVMIYWLLFGIALICSFLAGNSLAAAKPTAWIHMVAFASVFCVCLFMVLEIEFPRMGFADIEKYDQTLIDLRESMK